MWKSAKVLGITWAMIIVAGVPLALAQDPAAPPTSPEAAAPAPAAEPAVQADPQEAEDINYSYGSVVSAGDNKLVLLEYDYEKDEEVQVTYELEPTTEFNNVKSLAEFKKDDPVEIYYREAGGKKIAEIIALEEFPLELEEETGMDLEDFPAEDIAPEGVESISPAAPAGPGGAATK